MSEHGLLRERNDARIERDDARSLLASATDLLNTWAREFSVGEAETELQIKTVIDRLWGVASTCRIASLQAEYWHLKEEEARDALKGIMKQIECGALVRETASDDAPGWGMRQLPLVMALKAADDLLRNVEP